MDSYNETRKKKKTIERNLLTLAGDYSKQKEPEPKQRQPNTKCIQSDFNPNHLPMLVQTYRRIVQIYLSFDDNKENEKICFFSTNRMHADKHRKYISCIVYVAVQVLQWFFLSHWVTKDSTQKK